MARSRFRRNPSHFNAFRWQPQIQRLEERETPSVSAVGAEFPVNLGSPTGQQQSAIASDADGDFVAVWSSIGQDLDQYGIFARRYTAAGLPLATDFRVNTMTTGFQEDPAIGMDADGDFVVVWMSRSQDGSGYGIYGQRYRAFGTTLGEEFRVNTLTANNQEDPAVAMDADGDFVVTWTSAVGGGNGQDVIARCFSADGTPKGPDFTVNTFTTNSQGHPSVGMSAGGGFVISWSGSGANENSFGVFAQRYDAAGLPQGGEIHVNTFTTSTQDSSKVAVDADGDFVVAWEGNQQDGSLYGVYCQRFDKLGVPQGSELRVNVVTADNQQKPSVAIDANGDFAVVWMSTAQDGSAFGVYGRVYDPTGTPKGTEFRVNTFTTGDQRLPAVTSDAEGDLVVIWDGVGINDTAGIFAQRFDESVDAAGPWVTGVFVGGLNEPIRPGERLVGSVPSLTVAFSEDMATTGSPAVTNAALSWRLQRDGVDISNQIGALTFAFNAFTRRHEVQVPLAAPLTAGLYSLIIRSAVQDLHGVVIDGNFDGVEGGQSTNTFRVIPPAAGTTEFRANSFTVDIQRNPDTATDANGNIVVVWESNNQDGSNLGVYQRRIDNTGAVIGSDVRVNTTTALSQFDPAVARDADGDYVVVWTHTDTAGGSTSIRGQRYAANGSAQGSEFMISAGASGDTFSMPDVCMDADGNFVVAWKAALIEGLPSGIYFQRYSANGTAIGIQDRASVSTGATISQTETTVAMSATGEYFVGWQSSGQDGSGLGVYGRLYNSSGLPVTGEFRVNNLTGGDQDTPSAAMDADGDFVVAWRQEGGVEFGTSIEARRFRSDGTPESAEFGVSTLNTADNHLAPTASMDADGDFVIAFTLESGEGSGSGIQARRYSNGGVAQGTEFLVNLFTTGNQADPAVAMDADGDFVSVWQSNNQDGSNYGIYGRRYAAPPRIANVRVNDGSAQRSRVTSLTITFDNIVQFATTANAAISLTRNGGGAVLYNATISNVTGVTILTLDGFTGAETELNSLRDGRYLLTAQASQISNGTVQLDGDGNGTTGDNFTFGDPQGLFRFFGDINGDRRVDIADFGGFSTAYNRQAGDPLFNPAFDFNGDGRIDIADFGQFSVRYFTSLP